MNNAARANFEAALRALEVAHDALARDVNPDTLRLYETCCSACRVAFEALALAGLERARKARAT